jgi:hypothetical protein
MWFANKPTFEFFNRRLTKLTHPLVFGADLGADADAPIPLPNVSGKILEKVITYVSLVLRHRFLANLMSFRFWETWLACTLPHATGILLTSRMHYSLCRGL